MSFLFSIFLLFASSAYSETRTLNADGTTTITYSPGEREAILKAAEERRLNQMRQNMPNADTTQSDVGSPEGSTTRAATSCEDVSGFPGLKECSIALGAGGRSSVFYELNGKPYDGLVVKENGTYRLIPKDQIEKFAPSETTGTTINEQETPDIIDCGNPNRRTKYQCLVCNCFHEARGETFAEQVNVNRTVLSRVLSPAHPSNVCDVTHYTNAYEWTRISAPVSKGVMRKDIKLDESSLEFRLNFPGETNSLRSCKRASLESLKYEKEFFAVAYIKKGARSSYHTTCKEFADQQENLQVREANNLINSNINLAHEYFTACESREQRCIMYPTCELAPRSSPRPPLRHYKGSSGIDD